MAAWPLVQAALVAKLPTLTGWDDVSVFDMQPVTGDGPAEFVTVGYVPGEDFAGSYEQVTSESAWSVVESGTVRSQVAVQSGDTDLPARRVRAFALVDAWEQWVTDNPTLGVLEDSSTASLAVDVEPVQNSAGSAARLIVTVSYLARY